MKGRKKISRHELDRRVRELDEDDHSPEAQRTRLLGIERYSSRVRELFDEGRDDEATRLHEDVKILADNAWSAFNEE